MDTLDQPSSNQNQPATEQQQSPPLNSSLHLKTFLLIAGAIALMAISAMGGYYLGANKQSQPSQLSTQPPQSLPTPTSTPTPTPIAIPTVDPSITVNWKTYTSRQFKYSFKYPPDWPLLTVPLGNNGCDFCRETLEFSRNASSLESSLAAIEILENPNIKTFEDLWRDNSKIDLKYTILGGEKAVYYYPSDDPRQNTITRIVQYAVVKNGLIFSFKLLNTTKTNKDKQKNIETFDQILSTFQFTQ